MKHPTGWSSPDSVPTEIFLIFPSECLEQNWEWKHRNSGQSSFSWHFPTAGRNKALEPCRISIQQDMTWSELSTTDGFGSSSQCNSSRVCLFHWALLWGIGLCIWWLLEHCAAPCFHDSCALGHLLNATEQEWACCWLVIFSSWDNKCFQIWKNKKWNNEMLCSAIISDPRCQGWAAPSCPGETCKSPCWAQPCTRAAQPCGHPSSHPSSVQEALIEDVNSHCWSLGLEVPSPSFWDPAEPPEGAGGIALWNLTEPEPQTPTPVHHDTWGERLNVGWKTYRNTKNWLVYCIEIEEKPTCPKLCLNSVTVSILSPKYHTAGNASGCRITSCTFLFTHPVACFDGDSCEFG